MIKKFFKNLGPIDLAYIASKIDADIIAPSEVTLQPEYVKILNMESIENAKEGDITFLNNSKYEQLVEQTKATACIMKPEIAQNIRFKNLWSLVHPNPYFAYASVIDLLYVPNITYGNKVEKTAVVDPKAKIGKNVYIGHHTVIESGVEIKDNTIIGSNCFIGYGVQIGSSVRIDSNVSISYALIGNNVVILPGARIGQDGFGFASDQGKYKKITHIGKVVIEDDVEIGANTTIDRGSVTDTIIHSGARIDNLVQIAHNVSVGHGSILVAQSGIAGSTEIGNYVALGGQGGISGHVKIADKVQIAGQSGVIKSIPEVGAMYFGSPAMPIREWQKRNMLIKKVLHEYE